MPADVRSIPALIEWHAALAAFQEGAGEALMALNQEVRRLAEWTAEQGRLWSRAAREAEQAITQAKAELAARRFPGFDGRMPDTTVQERNLRRAVAKHDYATEKVATCRAWVGRLPKIIEEVYSASAHRLQMQLEGDVARGLAELTRQIEALERYAGISHDYAARPSDLPAPPTAASGESP